MTYRLGVDLGTTWTAAATWHDERATIVSLGQRRAAIPSVALLREDGEFLLGDAAARRAVAEPERVAREFKRRIGDTTPIIIGGTPQSAETLTAHLLRHVVGQVSALEGRPPAELAIAHPANWGAYKLDLLRQIIAEAGHDAEACLLITEPEAAAITYATEQRVAPGRNVCVYDLGGGTFDTTVVQRTSSGFRILGRPQGIERLGGVDFDAAIFNYVSERLGDALTELDPNDTTALSALARLRLDCTDVKEALSADVTATIPVFLPNMQTEIRITRSEFEGLIRPVLHDTIDTTRRAIASADLEPSDIDKVLLVGGSSRIPLVSQLVRNELDVDTAIDSHPKHAIALGTAIHRLAGEQGTGRPGSGVTIVVDAQLAESAFEPVQDLAPPPPPPPPARPAAAAPAAPAEPELTPSPDARLARPSTPSPAAPAVVPPGPTPQPGPTAAPSASQGPPKAKPVTSPGPPPGSTPPAAPATPSAATPPTATPSPPPGSGAAARAPGAATTPPSKAQALSADEVARLTPPTPPATAPDAAPSRPPQPPMGPQPSGSSGGVSYRPPTAIGPQPSAARPPRPTPPPSGHRTPAPARRKPDRAGRRHNPVVVGILVVLIALMVAFGVLLLFVPPSQILSLGALPPH
ncbi:MAG: Hsp70 family protein [Actinomycetota bacterium]